MLFIIANWRSQTATAIEAAEKNLPLWKNAHLLCTPHAEKKENNHRNYIYLCKVYGCVCMMLHNAMHISHAMRERKRKHTHIVAVIVISVAYKNQPQEKYTRLSADSRIHSTRFNSARIHTTTQENLATLSLLASPTKLTQYRPLDACVRAYMYICTYDVTSLNHTTTIRSIQIHTLFKRYIDHYEKKTNSNEQRKNNKTHAQIHYMCISNKHHCVRTFLIRGRKRNGRIHLNFV